MRKGPPNIHYQSADMIRARCGPVTKNTTDDAAGVTCKQCEMLLAMDAEKAEKQAAKARSATALGHE